MTDTNLPAAWRVIDNKDPKAIVATFPTSGEAHALCDELEPHVGNYGYRYTVEPVRALALSNGALMTGNMTRRQFDHLRVLADGQWHKPVKHQTSASCFIALYHRGYADMHINGPFKWRITEAGQKALPTDTGSVT